MGYEKPDTLSLKMPKKSEAGVRIAGEAYSNYIKAVREIENKYGAKELIEPIIDNFENTAYDIVSRMKQYLEDGYNAMWHLPSYLTGNFRGSIEVTGDFDTDPLGCDVEFNYDKFTTPKVLPTLKERTVRRSWNTKKSGAKSKTYVYPAGTKYKITGEDYSGRVPPQYIMDFLEEEKQMAKNRAGVF